MAWEVLPMPEPVLRIPRQSYLDWLIRWKDRQIIKVVSGVRRSGKSTLFELYRAYLLENSVGQKQIIALNFEDKPRANTTH